MERRRTGRSRRKLHRWEIKLRNIAIPALLTAVSMMVILIALDYFHFDLAYGRPLAMRRSNRISMLPETN